MKLAICTFARSEYGLMKNVIRLATLSFDTWLIAGAGHLDPEQGMTLKEVHNDALVPEDHLILADFSPAPGTTHSITAKVAQGMTALSEILFQHKFDAVMAMGDRHELFAVSVPALLQQIPLMHISGGEITEGAIDDSIRHSTTKLAHLHLVSNSVCAENVSRMGEEDWRIVITGEPGLDNIHSNDIATAAELQQQFGINPEKPTLLVTFHPSTLEPELSWLDQCTPLVRALEHLTHYQIIITASGVDNGAREIAEVLKGLAVTHPHIRYIPHLGSRNYLAVMRMATAVVGNSSSGLVEAPSLRIPSVNIGNRQKNRMASAAILHCGYSEEAILAAISRSDTPEHRALCSIAENPYDPYGDGHNSERVIKAARSFLEKTDLQKRMVKRFDPSIQKLHWNSLLL